MQAFLGGHGLQGGLLGSLAFAAAGPACLEILDQALERIRAAVEDQIFGQLAFFGWDLGVGGDVGRIDDGHIQTGLHAVIQHDAVEDGAGGWRQAKGDIADTPARSARRAVRS